MLAFDFITICTLVYVIIQLSVVPPVKTEGPALLLILAPVILGSQERNVEQVGLGHSHTTSEMIATSTLRSRFTSQTTCY